MIALTWMLKLVGHGAGIAAILMLVYACAGEFQMLMRTPQELTNKYDDYCYGAFLLLAIWMACEVGRIGL
jgi:hypothetical protein